MSIHGGSSSLGTRSRTVEITTTLYDLLEAMSDGVGTPAEPYTLWPVRDGISPSRDRLIARKVATMFLSGRIKFIRPRDIRKNFPEWCD